MTTKQTDEDLIGHILREAVKSDTPLAEAIDALKAVTGYRTMEQKQKTPEPEDDSHEPSFETFTRSLDAPNAATQVRNRRGTGPSGTA